MFSFVLLIIFLGVTSAFSIKNLQSGGSGHAVSFGISSSISASLPENILLNQSSYTFEFWIKLSCIKCDSQVIHVNDGSIDIKTSLFGLLIGLGDNVKLIYPHETTHIKSYEWNHLAFVFNRNFTSHDDFHIDDGTNNIDTSFKLFVNGTYIPREGSKKDLSLVKWTFESQNINKMLNMPTKPSETWKGAKAIGGYLGRNNISDCALPFNFNGKTFYTCIDFYNPPEKNSKLFQPYDEDKDGFKFVHGLNLWCPTINIYGLNKEKKKKKMGIL